MVKFIRSDNGNEMWVADDRVEEYKAAGHKPAAEVSAENPTTKAKTTKRSK